MTAALYYHPEAYTTSGPKLMGRNAAGESFLRGFLRHSHTDAFWAQIEKPEHGQHFAQTVAAAGRTQAVKLFDKSQLAALAQVGAIYYPGPGLSEHVWQRAAFGHGQWSVCGITHTTASAGAMDAIADWITAPVQPWDAVICTSQAAKSNVLAVLQAQLDYLQQRLGVSRWQAPLMPVIPLGIHTEDFAYSEQQKSAARQQLGADANTLVVLFMGRLSFHAKAHPLALYQALAKASQQLHPAQRIVLVECGWHANDYIQRAYQAAAEQACPRVQVITLDGRDPAARQTAWAGADVFCSLSDNIQETFGIVPIEAMAAGLPVVVSDWDGYKDTVRDGVDGFRIPTVMPQAGLGGDLALRHALQLDTYDMYCGHTCSLIAVDVEATAQALSRLFASAALRQEMGQAGRQRAQQHYDWAAIIPQYYALWAEQASMRQAQSPALASLAQPWPARMDPFHSFASYPSQPLTPETRLALVDNDADAAWQRLEQAQQLAMVNFAKQVIPTTAELQQLLQTAAQGPTTAMALVQTIAPERQAFVLRSLAWLVKLSIVKLA